MVFSLALKDDRVAQCLRSCGSEFQMWGPKQEKSLVLLRPVNQYGHIRAITKW